MNILNIGLTPQDLGLPFESWRKGQLETIQRIIDTDKSVIILRQPTGGGKSAIALAAQKILNADAIIVTKTKILQEQYEDQNVSGLYGRDNYVCNRFPIVSAAHGICHLGQSCRLRYGGCDYYDQKRKATNASIAVLNYSYFFLEANGPGEFSGRKLAILDEGHSVPDELSRSYTIRISHADARKLQLNIPRGSQRADLNEWRQWAAATSPYLAHISRNATGDRANLCGNLLAAVLSISFIQDPSNWVVQTDQFRTTIRPIWVDRLARDYLWRHARKFLVMSATINPYQFLDELGWPTERAEIIDVPSNFPADRRPIYLYPFHYLSHKSSDAQTQAMVKDLDAILDKYSGRVLVHTGNYGLSHTIAANSRHSKRIITHTKDSRSQKLGIFKTSKGAGKVLVSPSMTEGVDLPYELCQAQIIVKCPFPNRGDMVWEARFKSDKQKGEKAYTIATINSLVQAYGRGMRAPDDNCETWILDANIIWLLNRNTRDFPRFFQEAVRVKQSI